MARGEWNWSPAQATRCGPLRFPRFSKLADTRARRSALKLLLSLAATRSLPPLLAAKESTACARAIRSYRAPRAVSFNKPLKQTAAPRRPNHRLLLARGEYHGFACRLLWARDFLMRPLFNGGTLIWNDGSSSKGEFSSFSRSFVALLLKLK